MWTAAKYGPGHRHNSGQFLTKALCTDRTGFSRKGIVRIVLRLSLSLRNSRSWTKDPPPYIFKLVGLLAQQCTPRLTRHAPPTSTRASTSHVVNHNSNIMASTNRIRNGTLQLEGHALLAWFSSIASPNRKLTMKDLTDGLAIWSMLQQIRPEAFTGDLPEKSDGTSTNWLAYWQNLKYIHRSLASYITNEAGRLPKSFDGLDLQAIAQSEGTADAIQVRLNFSEDDTNFNCTTQLLKMVLYTAVNADVNAPYITPMAFLPQDQQALVQKAIMEVSAWDSDSSQSSEHSKIQDIAESPDTHDEAEPFVFGDKDLYWEEQLSILSREKERVMAEKKDLLASMQEQSDRIFRLTSNNSSLQDKLASLQDKLENPTNASLGGPALKLMETRLKERDDHIAYQEAQLKDMQEAAEELEKHASKYRELQAKIQPLQDSHDELKAERDALLRKANTMDKYKAKLQTLTDVEKENEFLRSDMDELREVSKDGELAKEQAKVFEIQLEEMSRMIPSIEQELFESKRMKQQLDDSARQMRRQLEEANTRYEQDQSTIRDLIDQLQPDSSLAQELDNLENELDQHENTEKAERSLVAEHILECSRLNMLNSHVGHEKIAKNLREALVEQAVRYKALESMLEAAKLRSAKLEGIIEKESATDTEVAALNGSPFAIPGQFVLADLQLRHQERQRAREAELQRERGILGEEGGDSSWLFCQTIAKHAYEDKAILLTKDEVDRLRGFEAAAEETDALRTMIKSLKAQLSNMQPKEVTPSFLHYSPKSASLHSVERTQLCPPLSTMAQQTVNRPQRKNRVFASKDGRLPTPFPTKTHSSKPKPEPKPVPEPKPEESWFHTLDY